LIAATVLAASAAANPFARVSGGKALWSLSGGQSVSADLAIILTSNTSVAPVDDALFQHAGANLRYVR
jgi:hypothetical protein